MPKHGDSDAVKAVKKMIAERLTTRERAMLQAWILARFDVRGLRPGAVAAALGLKQSNKRPLSKLIARGE